jgi:hypothetical protein
MALTIEADLTIAEIDEALAHASKMLQTDVYGNRMDWRKRELLSASIDDLLDARLQMSVECANGNN